MATYTKVKNLNVSTCSSELTLNSIYTIVSDGDYQQTKGIRNLCRKNMII